MAAIGRLVARCVCSMFGWPLRCRLDEIGPCARLRRAPSKRPAQRRPHPSFSIFGAEPIGGRMKQPMLRALILFQEETKRSLGGLLHLVFP